MSLPPKDLTTPIFSLTTSRPVYLPICPKRSSGCCFLVNAEDEMEPSMRTTSRIGLTLAALNPSPSNVFPLQNLGPLSTPPRPPSPQQQHPFSQHQRIRPSSSQPAHSKSKHSANHLSPSPFPQKTSASQSSHPQPAVPCTFPSVPNAVRDPASSSTQRMTPRQVSRIRRIGLDQVVARK